MATAPFFSNLGRAGDSDSDHGFGVGRVDLVGGLDDVGDDDADLQPGLDADQRPLPTPHLLHFPQPR